MANYAALIAAWNSTALPSGVNAAGTPLSSSMTSAQKLAAVNGWTVAGPNVDVPVSAIVGYLGLNAKLATLIKYAATAPATEAGVAGAELIAVIQCPNAPGFRTSQASVLATLQTMLSALAGDVNSGIAAGDVTALLALAATTMAWWQAPTAQNGAGLTSPVTEADLEAAGGLT